MKIEYSRIQEEVRSSLWGEWQTTPVTNEITIRITLLIIIVLKLLGGLLDVKVAFLQGEFENNEKQTCMQVPQGMEKHYPDNVWLLLLALIYGLKNAAIAFWKNLLKLMKSTGCTRSWSDPFLCFKWNVTGIFIWLSWIDDCIYCGKTEDVAESKKEVMK